MAESTLNIIRRAVAAHGEQTKRVTQPKDFRVAYKRRLFKAYVLAGSTGDAEADRILTTTWR